MTLDQLKYFNAVASYGHLGNAAKSIPISPSAVSTAIASLETEFGCLLFERKKQRLILTQKGLLLKTESQFLLERASQIKNRVSNQAKNYAGSFRLSGSSVMMTHFLAKAWAKIQSRHAQLVGELRALPTALAVNEVLSGRSDAALVLSVPRQVGLKKIELYQGQLRLVVRQRHPLTRLHHPFKLLNHYPACFHQPSSGVDLCHGHPALAKNDIAPEVKLTFDSDEIAIENICATNSWAMVPDLVAQKFSNRVVTLTHPRSWSAPYDLSWITREERSELSFWPELRTELTREFCNPKARSDKKLTRF